jgi:two-component system phosphate regulon response regulator PhoB
MAFDKLPPKILVLEPEEQLNATICNTIERNWFDVVRAKNGLSAIDELVTKQISMVIISSHIEDLSIEEVIQNFKSDIPIILIIDKHEDLAEYKQRFENRVQEILQRPVVSVDLITVIKNLMRKARPVFQEKILRHRDIKVDLSNFRITRGVKNVHLGPTEFKIVQLLVGNPNQVFSRQNIIEYVWGANKDISDRTIDVHINRIRTLMKHSPEDTTQVIRTIRSEGYCIE